MAEAAEEHPTMIHCYGSLRAAEWLFMVDAAQSGAAIEASLRRGYPEQLRPYSTLLVQGADGQWRDLIKAKDLGRLLNVVALAGSDTAVATLVSYGGSLLPQRSDLRGRFGSSLSLKDAILRKQVENSQRIETLFLWSQRRSEWERLGSSVDQLPPRPIVLVIYPGVSAQSGGCGGQPPRLVVLELRA
eukprot:GHVU01189057.1.p2 GENE.GHVU01189057.1~~GHVU01189057.1.p2  ORF type:complete len:188 (-),score=30.56 GHVU01189057.1:1728-2291(-)